MRPSAKAQRARGADPESPWYRVEDLARLFDVGERCIWTWVAEKKLPEPRRHGSRWSRWPKEEIDGLLARWGRAG